MIDRARSTIVDCGYREAAERRERLVANASPAVRARILGTRPAYGADDAAPTATGGAQGEVDRLQREIRELALVQKAMQGELEALRRQQAMAPASRAIADVARRFVAELAHVGYRIQDDPVTLADLQSPRRAQAWCRPRMVAMWLCTSIAREGSTPRVGRFFARDHTTVLHARQQIGRVLKQAPELRIAALATCAALGAEPPAGLHGQP